MHNNGGLGADGPCLGKVQNHTITTKTGVTVAPNGLDIAFRSFARGHSLLPDPGTIGQETT